MTDELSDERESIIWKNRELTLRNRVLQAQINVAKQEKQATLDRCKAVLESIKSINEDKYLCSKVKQTQLLQEKQVQLTQLNLEVKTSKGELFAKTRLMIEELWNIYPIVEFPDRKGYSICDIHLPSSNHFDGHDENMISVAIGYISHLLLLLSNFLDISLRFPLSYCGSKSIVYCNRRNQSFPLFVESFKSKEWINFSYGMGLLNLNIKQLRTLFGLSTNDLDESLANLHGLKIFLLE